MNKIMVLFMVVLIIGCTPEPLSAPIKAIQPAAIPNKIDVTITECANAPIGKNVTCRILRAYCSYQPKTKGAPTFCNDAPYPNHHFILLRWGENWNQFNGKCLIITGYNILYKGKPEIIATSLSQVKTCD